ATADVCPGCSDGSVVSGNFCFELDNTVWFSFRTNAIGGAATVSISNISCLVEPDNDDELQAVIIEAVVPCDETTYSAVSNCVAGSSVDFDLNAAALNPNTTYYVLIDGDINGSINPAECDFEILVAGPAVDVSITTTSSSQTCGFTDVQIDITGVSGGTPPYQYNINNGAYQGNTTFINLVAGTYQILAQDDLGCVYYAGNQTVGQTGGPSGGSVSTIDDNCLADGEIQITGVAGGTTPFSYTLSNGTTQASGTFSGLVAGTYNVVITDASGCFQQIDNISVLSNGGPDNPVLLTTEPICGLSDGTIDLTVSGGLAPYLFSLNGGVPQASGTFANLSSGLYNITVADQNGCVYVYQNIVLNNSLVADIPSASLSSAPNPACVGDIVSFTATTSQVGTTPVYQFFVNGSSVQTGASNSYNAVFNDGDLVY